MTPLHLVLELSGKASTEQALQLMRDARARVDIPDNKGHTALHYAIRAHNRDVVEYLLRNYTFESSSKNIEDNTISHGAVPQSSNLVVDTLLKNNSSPMVENREGTSASTSAVECGDPETRAQGPRPMAMTMTQQGPGSSFLHPDESQNQPER
jgi:ankyrin repeat protein